MKNKKLFTKVFIYMIIGILLIVAVTATLFSQQISSLYRTLQTREVIDSYKPLIERISRSEGSTLNQIGKQFYENNQSFEFYIANISGKVLYATPGASTSEKFKGDFYFVVHRDQNISIIAQRRTGLEDFYQEWITRIFILAIMTLFMCLGCAYFFARELTKPIMNLVEITGDMAQLKEVSRPSNRNDELGILSRDVYQMYEKLKNTIESLEAEVKKTKLLEETQRYFFYAASHELKTPLAGISVMLEGMLEEVGPYSNHPKYLRECLKLVDIENNLVSEILTIVSLTEGRVRPAMNTFSLKAKLDEWHLAFIPLIASAGCELILNIEDGLICKTDIGLLKKVYSNVFLNAIQNTPKGETITVSCLRQNQMVRMSVTNTGVSLEENIIEKLYEPFYRLDESRNKENGRSGLGLTIVKKTLEALDLAFSLENVAQGVQFWVEIPMAKVD